jgi:ABC-type transporter Mla subunit MlaD
VNVFLLVALLLAAVFMGLVAYKQGWLVPHTTIHFVAGNALGINKGMPVKLYGFTVGSIKDMELAATGVEVRMSISSEHLPRMPKDSHARLMRESGVVGATTIDIVPGKSGEALHEGDRIGFEPSRGVSEIIDDLRKQMAPAFAELRQVLSQMNRSGEGMPATMKTLQAEAQRLPETHEALRKALRNADRAALDVAQAARSADGAAKSARRTADNMDGNVPALAAKLSTTLDSVGSAAGQLRQTGEEAQETLRAARPVLERGDNAARQAGEVFGAVKRVWPLSDSFRDASERTLPIDSFEARQ